MSSSIGQAPLRSAPRWHSFITPWYFQIYHADPFNLNFFENRWRWETSTQHFFSGRQFGSPLLRLCKTADTHPSPFVFDQRRGGLHLGERVLVVRDQSVAAAARLRRVLLDGHRGARSDSPVLRAALHDAISLCVYLLMPRCSPRIWTPPRGGCLSCKSELHCHLLLVVARLILLPCACTCPQMDGGCRCRGRAQAGEPRAPRQGARRRPRLCSAANGHARG